MTYIVINFNFYYFYFFKIVEKKMAIKQSTFKFIQSNKIKK